MARWLVTIRKVTYQDAEVEVEANEEWAAQEEAMDRAATLDYDEGTVEYERSTVPPELVSEREARCSRQQLKS